MPKGKRFPQTRQYVALNIKYARTMLGLTQEELAELADLDRTQIGAIERLVSGASVDSLGMLGKAVGVPAHVLMMPPTEAHPIILALIEKRHNKKAP